MKRPVDHTDTIQISGPEHQICIPRRLKKPGNVLWIVREITVHLEYELVRVFECPCESGAIGSAKAFFGCAMQHMDSRFRRSDLFCKSARTIG